MVGERRGVVYSVITTTSYGLRSYHLPSRAAVRHLRARSRRSSESSTSHGPRSPPALDPCGGSDATLRTLRVSDSLRDRARGGRASLWSRCEEARRGFLSVVCLYDSPYGGEVQCASVMLIRGLAIGVGARGHVQLLVKRQAL